MYSKGYLPDNYKCSVTGKSGVKLWRQSHTLASNVSLLCREEALKREGISEDDPDLYGDQIGGLVPAIPVDDTFWGYTSAPLMGVFWWYNLDGHAKQESIRSNLTPQQEFQGVFAYYGEMCGRYPEVFDEDARAALAYWQP